MRVEGLVLILIVVDNGLVRYFSTLYTRNFKRLNPYCSGQWSRTNSVNLISELPSVLILIVVDNGFVPPCASLHVVKLQGLNPYCSGR